MPFVFSSVTNVTNWNWIGEVYGYESRFDRRTHEQRVLDAKELGLFICECLPVETSRGRVLIFNPSCEVHGGVCRRCGHALPKGVVL